MEDLEPKIQRKFKSRGQIMIGISVLIGAIFLGVSLWWVLSRRFEESTDNAYVKGNIVLVSSAVSGTVQSINVEDANSVKIAQVLLSLNQDDTHLLLQKAKSALAQVVRETKILYVSHVALKSAVDAANAHFLRAQNDFTRREKLFSSGGVSKEELAYAQVAVVNNKAILQANQDKLLANEILVGDTDLQHNPNVLRAAEVVREAYLAQVRTQVLAPVSGYIAKRNVEVGEQISAGMPLMSIIPLSNLWVDANFKETQLKGIRIGQNVSLTSDMYGADVVFHGKVLGISPGTGSAFALLPAQNASGNWIKIVQRVPVRISLDPKELIAYPLRIGLSMQATVDIKNTLGTSLTHSTAVIEKPVYNSDVDVAVLNGANALVKKIIVSNSKI